MESENLENNVIFDQATMENQDIVVQKIVLLLRVLFVEMEL